MLTSEFTIDNVHEALGLPGLHSHQRDAISIATSGRDLLVIVATGGGKTGGFLGAGLIMEGLTLVISPLRSLMADQRRRLDELGLPVLVWNSDVPDKEKDQIIRMIDQGWRGFLYTTPESLKGQDLSAALKNRVTLAVIDEAHSCLRERGFRISYAWLGRTLDYINPQVRYACTATLPAQDRRQLIGTLNLKDPELIVLPVARSNLTIKIVNRDEYQLYQMLDAHRGQAGIIFCSTVRTAEAIHAKMRSQGRHVALYHGQLTAKEKKVAQEAFMSGKLPVAIVTDAFLLGIDKRDLRFVAHYDFPKSIEDWVQGFGRAGRDGLPSTVYGCFRGSKEGMNSRRFLIDSTHPDVHKLRAVWEYLTSAPFHDATAQAIAMHVLGNEGKYCGNQVLTHLQRYGLAGKTVNPNDRRKRIYSAKGNFDSVDWHAYVHEKTECLDRFKRLCEVVGLPESRIPDEVDRYFADEVRHDIEMSDRGDYPASWD